MSREYVIPVEEMTRAGLATDFSLIAVLRFPYDEDEDGEPVALEAQLPNVSVYWDKNAFCDNELDYVQLAIEAMGGALLRVFNLFEEQPEQDLENLFLAELAQKAASRLFEHEKYTRTVEDKMEQLRAQLHALGVTPCTDC